MLPEVTRLWLNRYDVQVTIARLFQNVNLRILDCTRGRWRGLDLLGEKRKFIIVLTTLRTIGLELLEFFFVYVVSIFGVFIC